MSSIYRCLFLLFLACFSVSSKKLVSFGSHLAKNGHFLARLVKLHNHPCRLSSMGITMSSTSSEPSPSILSLPLPDPGKIDPQYIAEWILQRGSKNLVIIDVRDDDYVEGGHIKGCINIPSGIFMDKWTSCDGLLTTYATNSESQTFVFHCMASQVRGPKAARRFVSRINDQGLPEGMPIPTVKILRGGFEGFQRLYGASGEGLLER